VLRLLAGLWKPSAGEAQFDQRPLREYSRRELARHVTFVPQDTRVEFGFTVRDIVSMGRHPHLGRFDTEREEDRRAVWEALDRADLLHLTERPVNELSGGERQRVLIARSLATAADVILFDEPTSNLDVDHSLEILELIRRLCRDGKAVVLSLHDLNAVSRCADRVAVLHRGGLHAFGSAGETLQAAIVEPVFSVQMERLHNSDGDSVLFFHRGRHANRG
jgi:iron complex transport system ATP-binding protein